MKLLIFLLVLILLFSGCNEPPRPAYFNGIESAPVKSECVNSMEDVCSLFGCMTDLCWCDEGPDQILFEGNTVVTSEAEAMQVVSDFIFAPHKALPQGIEIERAVKINSVFYNVFVLYPSFENVTGDDRDEYVFTVAADGTIIKTVCGV
ncbi:MAG: hypothetical protein ABIH20_04025 [Candidatus Diapherotrites archaeon]